MSRIAAFLGWVAVTAALGTAAALTERLPGDLTATVWLQEHARGLDGVMRAASAAGDLLPAAGVMVLAALGLYCRGQRAYALALPALAVTALAIPVLKTLVERPRPSADLVQVLIEEGGYSFPSGHALGMALAMGAVICLARPLCGKQTWLVWPLRMAAAAAALTVGVARAYLGVHWTSDVLGGFLLGGLALFAGVLLYQEIAASGRRVGKGGGEAKGSKAGTAKGRKGESEGKRKRGDHAASPSPGTHHRR